MVIWQHDNAFVSTAFDVFLVATAQERTLWCLRD